MATIKCPECKNDVSETVKKCPHCGYKIKSQKKLDISQITSKIKTMDKKKKIICFSVIGVIIFGVIILIIGLSPGTVKKTEREIVRDSIQESLIARASFYNDKLYYSSYSVSVLKEVQENSYVASGYVYFNRTGSSKKWETEYSCRCNYYSVSNDASCNCQLGKNATIVP